MEGVKVELDGKHLKVERHPAFLGVKYDEKLVFGEQCDKAVEKARGRVKLLRALAGRDWDWSKKLLKATYVASVRSVLLHWAVAWTPWLSRAQWNKLEAVQREAARVMTGMVRNAPGKQCWKRRG